MTKRQDLYLQRCSRPEQSDQRQPNQAANISHQPRASPDSTSLASRIEFPTMTGGLVCSACGKQKECFSVASRFERRPCRGASRRGEGEMNELEPDAQQQWLWFGAALLAMTVIAMVATYPR